MSLLAHLAAVLTAWRLATRLIGDERAGFLAALLFALHPLTAEPVAWAAAVNDPLAGALVLSALVAHARWRARAPEGAARPFVDRVPVAGGVLALLALLAKEQALVVPLLVIGLDLALRRLPSARSLAPYVVALGVWYLARAVIFETCSRDSRSGKATSASRASRVRCRTASSSSAEPSGSWRGPRIWPCSGLCAPSCRQVTRA